MTNRQRIDQVDRPHLREWIDAGKATALPVDVAARLSEHLDSQPWSVTRLDWETLGGSLFHWARRERGALRRWIRTTAFADDDSLIFLFTRREPCLACDLDFGIERLDYVFGHHPGMAYFFGASNKGRKARPNLGHFAEYDGGDWLTARASAP